MKTPFNVLSKLVFPFALIYVLKLSPLSIPINIQSLEEPWKFKPYLLAVLAVFNTESKSSTST